MKEELREKIIEILNKIDYRTGYEEDPMDTGLENEKELSDQFFKLFNYEKQKLVEDIIKFIESENGKSGRKEIINYLKELNK